jgi:hypothetical protein
MAISIPSGVFTKYKEFADEMITSFGVSCSLIYTHQVEVITESVPTVKQRRSLNIQNRNESAGFSRGSSTFKTVENTDTLTMRVYRNKKDFIKIGQIDVPDGAIQTISYLSDLPKLNRAIALITDTQLSAHETYRYVKVSEPVPHGLEHDRYIICLWKRE